MEYVRDVMTPAPGASGAWPSGGPGLTAMHAHPHATTYSALSGHGQKGSTTEAAISGLQPASSTPDLLDAGRSRPTTQRQLYCGLRKYRSHGGTELQHPAARLRRTEAGW